MEIRRKGSRQILLDTFYCFYNLIVSWNLYFRSPFNCIMKYFEYLNFIDFHYVYKEILVLRVSKVCIFIFMHNLMTRWIVFSYIQLIFEFVSTL